MGTRWKLALPVGHRTSGSTDCAVVVGGTGDFDDAGRIAHPDAPLEQVDGALANLAQSLLDEGSALDDLVRVKAFATVADEQEHWQLLAALKKALPTNPAPVIIVHPVPMQPFTGQRLQLQALAVPGWRQSSDIRSAEAPPPTSAATFFPAGERLTTGLRAGELIALSGQSALAEDGTVRSGDGIQQTHVVFERLQAVLHQLGASLQDSVKKEGYYFGTNLEQWASMASVRASYFREPGPVATVVPCQQLWPEGLLTRVELLAMRAERGGFDKYIPRDDSWPERVWDWPIPVPYRQGIRLRNTIWLGGQVAFEPGGNSGRAVHAGDLGKQTRLCMRFVEDILRGFGAVTSDLELLVCYFESNGQEETTVAFAETLAGCVAGPLPPVTLVPQPAMHSEDMAVEIWGLARGGAPHST